MTRKVTEIFYSLAWLVQRVGEAHLKEVFEASVVMC